MTEAVLTGTPGAEEVRAVVEAVVAGVLDDRGGEGPANAAAPDDSRPGALADVASGGDHGGFHLKQQIAAELREHGWSVEDCGAESPEPTDYPDHAHAVARMVSRGEARWGIVVDGAGIGSAITANKVPGVRAATCWDISSARNSREHNHANVLALGAGLIGEGLALQIVREWLRTPWGGDRHARRVAKIVDVEKRYLRGEQA